MARSHQPLMRAGMRSPQGKLFYHHIASNTSQWLAPQYQKRFEKSIKKVMCQEVRLVCDGVSLSSFCLYIGFTNSHFRCPFCLTPSFSVGKNSFGGLSHVWLREFLHDLGTWKDGQRGRHQEGLPLSRISSSSWQGRWSRKIQRDPPSLWGIEPAKKEPLQ